MNAFFRNRKRSELLGISSKWKDKKGEADTVFTILENLVHTLTVYRFQGGKERVADFPADWIRFAEKAPLKQITGLNDRIREARKQITFNVNYQAVCEQLLLAFIGEIDQWAN